MQLFICLNVQRNEKDHALTYLWHQKTCTYSLQIFYEIQKNLKEKQKTKKKKEKEEKKTNFNLWHQNVCTRSLKMFCKIQRSNLTKKITFFIFYVKNVRTSSSNIKLKRYKISFSLLANYSIKTPPHVCVETFGSHPVYIFFNSYIL